MIPRPTETSGHRPRLLVATTNPGKLREIRKILGDLPIQLVTLDEHPLINDPEETGTTFAANAKLKARYYAHSTDELTVAEDSGLEIDALDGAPGVRSARFNGESYQEKFRTISQMLNERGRTTSTARFVCAVAVWLKDSMVWETVKTVEGRLKLPPQGDKGFGYDPIFYYPPYGRTLAEVNQTEKEAISHRGQAFRALRTNLNNILAKI